MKLTELENKGELSITPAGLTKVNFQGSQTYVITPGTGYQIADVIVDGQSVGSVATYTFSNVTCRHTIEAKFAPTPPPPEEKEEAKPKPKPWERTDIGYYEETNTGFTTLFYSRFFRRPPDQAGLDSWVAWLESGAITGAELVIGFIFGEECQARISDYTSADFITFLYRVLFDREPEDYGFNAWLSRMNAGMTKEEVVDRFVHGEEFVNLCNTFGIMPYEGYIGTEE